MNGSDGRWHRRSRRRGRRRQRGAVGDGYPSSALAAAAAIAILAAGCGSARHAAQAESPTPAQAKELLTARLRAKQLDFRWVACVRNGRTFRGAGIVRCNVNFGDPHIEAYCSVLEDGRLVTDHENSAIPCARDTAGWSATVSEG